MRDTTRLSMNHVDQHLLSVRNVQAQIFLKVPYTAAHADSHTGHAADDVKKPKNCQIAARADWAMPMVYQLNGSIWDVPETYESNHFNRNQFNFLRLAQSIDY